MYEPAPVPMALTMILATQVPDDAARIAYAYQFAAQAHRGQMRDEGTPFIDHPVAVATILWSELGSRDADMLVAALMHDVLEDSPEIESTVVADLIGPRAFELVEAVTKPPVPDADKPARDRAYLDRIRDASANVRLLKLADRIHNLRQVVHANDPAKANRYLEVSRQEFYPIALATSAAAARLIAAACDDIERYLATLDNSIDAH
ncbi:MAG: bifunctional (p)ppGpp synthetase/guanosine-3',5'-bis(diphosphate) 3'-pyrophosphohydrolase [Thermomicrobiales bacterium]|nr:bifunctional (p)ppGpp synthetase/guanosine-3',5'-bis(diphosphate) 3'-pyrophosphohydrolase [Thermomicrobiales bacterium]